jgi:hypothetical protein
VGISHRFWIATVSTPADPPACRALSRFARLIEGGMSKPAGICGYGANMRLIERAWLAS